ncbi:hypothetical protein [Cupriavidus basilensis]
MLDLSPHNSLVRYLVERGHTVFLISWKNPREEARDLGMNDYLELGLFDALTQVRRIIGAKPVHAAGYCLGGTLLAIGAAALARDIGPKSVPLKTVTLFAAQTDFSEPGELGLFIDASELAYLDALMWEQGYLDGTQMAAAFQLLHSRDLIWSRLMREYLLGQHPEPTDLMAWNADTTRLPYRMHSENLQRLYLHNDLAEGQVLRQRAAGGAHRPQTAHLCRRHRTGPRVTLALRVQTPPVDQHRDQFPAHLGRPQCGHCLRTGPCRASLSLQHAPQARPLFESERMVRKDTGLRRFMVAVLAAVAGRTFR